MFLKIVGGSFSARPWGAEIGVRVAPEGPAHVFEKSMPRRSNPEGVSQKQFGAVAISDSPELHALVEWPVCKVGWYEWYLVGR